VADAVDPSRDRLPRRDAGVVTGDSALADTLTNLNLGAVAPSSQALPPVRTE